MDTLKDLLTQLARKRQEAIDLGIKADKIAEEIATSVIGLTLSETEARQKDAKAEVAQLEQTIKSQAYLEWLQLPDHAENKHPFPGIDVKRFEIVKVIDEKKALAWAVQNMPSALKLNTSTLEKGVKALELDFIEKGEEFRVQIASNLDEYLKGNEDES